MRVDFRITIFKLKHVSISDVGATPWMTSWSLPTLQEEVQGFVQEEGEGLGRNLSDQVPGYSRDQSETSVLHHLLPKNQVTTSGVSFLSFFHLDGSFLLDHLCTKAFWP